MIFYYVLLSCENFQKCQKQSYTNKIEKKIIEKK